jgi:glycosyltransferase involved in cell wall biosynthesis
MKIAYILKDINIAGGPRVIKSQIEMLLRNNINVEIYSVNNDAEWKYPIIFYTPRIENENDSELKHKEWNTYDLIISDGLAGIHELELIKHPNKWHFCQMYDLFMFPEFKYIIDRTYSNTKIIVHSEANYQLIKLKYPNTIIKKIPNGIYFDPISTPKYPSENIISMLSFYSAFKDVPLLDRIFDNFEDTTFIGGKNYNPVNSKKFIYSPNEKEKFNLLRNHGVYVHTSWYETWGLGPIEAMSQGTPVVGTNSLGIMEFCNQKNSIILNNRDANLISKEIYSLLNDRNRYFDMSYEAIETCREFDIKKIEEEFINAIRLL